MNWAVAGGRPQGGAGAVDSGGREAALGPFPGVRVGVTHTLFTFMALTLFILYIKGHGQSVKPRFGDSSNVAESCFSCTRPQFGLMTSPKRQLRVLGGCQHQLYFRVCPEERRFS